MTTIPLARHLISAVRAGRKTATLRRGRRLYSAGHATFVAGEQEIPIEILSVQHLPLNDVGPEVAAADGYCDIASLRSALETFYPGLDDSEEVTVVQFRLA